MNRFVALTPLAVLLGLAALFGFYGLEHDPHVTPAALVGRTIPPLALAPLAGGPPAPFPDLGQAPLLVNFFASWCVPCATEAPELGVLRAQGVRIAGVAYKDDVVATRGFLARLGDPFASVALDPTGRAGIEYGVSGVPETFVVDGHGRILAKHAGALSAADAAALLARVSPRR